MKKMKLLGALLLVSTLLVSCGDSTTSKKAVKSTDKAKTTEKVSDKAKETEKSDKKETSKVFKDNTLSTDEVEIKYTGSEKTVDYDGKPTAYVFFTVTNKKDEAEDGMMLLLSYVEFSQNLGATTKRVDYAMVMDSPYQDKLDLLNQQINPEGTVDIAYPVNIDDESKPLAINFKENMFDSKPVGTIEVDVK